MSPEGVVPPSDGQKQIGLKYGILSSRLWSVYVECLRRFGDVPPGQFAKGADPLL
jgi:hypothetical protein